MPNGHASSTAPTTAPAAASPNPWFARSATELAAAIAGGEVTSRAVLESFLGQIARANPRVNAATVVFAERSLAEADAADRARDAGEPLGPLHGVPFSVKENIDLTWSASTSGVAAFQAAIPAEDDVVVARLRAAGAIPLLRTNMPDLGMRWHTDNDLFGETLNPWDPARSCGGSSGGEAVAIATGMVPLGLGNDYGGSLRLPAFAAGITAIRPTMGRVPIYRPGPTPPMPLTGQLFAVQGPLGRSVEDVETALRLIAGPDGDDPWAMPVPWSESYDGPRRVAVVTDPGGGGVDPAIAAVVRRAAEALAGAGWDVEEAEPPRIADAARLWRQLSTTELRTGLFDPAGPIYGLLSAGARRYMDDNIAATEPLDQVSFNDAIAQRLAIASAWRRFLTRYPVLLGPVSTQQMFGREFDLTGPDATTAQWHAHRLLVTVNFLGLPSLALPMGISAAGLPEGVQLISTAFGEAACLAAGRDLEAAVGPGRLATSLALT